MSLFRALLRKVLGDYQFFRIYSIVASNELQVLGKAVAIVVEQVSNTQDLSTSRYPEIRSLAQYHREEAFCIVARCDGEVAAACWFWAGAAYKTRNFWPLSPDEAKLVQITTAEVFRGRGIATTLLMRATAAMFGLGYRRLFARVWHSNRASIRAFEQAGWEKVAWVIEIQPVGTTRTLRMVLGMGGRFLTVRRH